MNSLYRNRGTYLFDYRLHPKTTTVCSWPFASTVFTKTLDVIDYKFYKEALNVATNEIRISKRSFEQTLANDIKMIAYVSMII